MQNYCNRSLKKIIKQYYKKFWLEQNICNTLGTVAFNMADFLKTQNYLNNSKTQFEKSYMSANGFEGLKR